MKTIHDSLQTSLAMLISNMVRSSTLVFQLSVAFRQLQMIFFFPPELKCWSPFWWMCLLANATVLFPYSFYFQTSGFSKGVLSGLFASSLDSGRSSFLSIQQTLRGKFQHHETFFLRCYRRSKVIKDKKATLATLINGPGCQLSFFHLVPKTISNLLSYSNESTYIQSTHGTALKSLIVPSLL